MKCPPLLAALVGASVLLPGSATACATCFGGDGSAMSKGASAGILFLLVVILGVLGTVGSFFVFLGRRMSAAEAAEEVAAASAEAPPTPMPDSTHS